MSQTEKIEVTEQVLAVDAEQPGAPVQEPLICLSCGAVKFPGVSLPCGH